MKYLNKLSMSIGVVGGYLATKLGGYDVLLQSILILVVIDYLTGILKGFYNKKLSSEIGRKGIINKVMIFLVICVSVVIERIIGGSTPIREITIAFFIGNEGISILENASEFLPIPKKLEIILKQLRDGEVNE